MTSVRADGRSAREKALHSKVAKAQKQLHRTREELRRRSADKDAKPDWTLALRFRLTAELRAELEAIETGWRADRQRHMGEVEGLQRTLSQLRAEKEASVTRLVKDLVELQRLHAHEASRGQITWDLLKAEVR